MHKKKKAYIDIFGFQLMMIYPALEGKELQIIIAFVM